MNLSAACATRLAAPAVLAGALAGSCAAETTAAADAVVAQCARLLSPASELAEGLDATPGLTRLPLEAFAPDGAHGRALRMAIAYNRALEGIVGTDLLAPEEQLMHAFRATEADSPWLFSQPGIGGGVAAYVDGDGTVFVIDRAYTTGRQGRRTTQCLFIAPQGAAPLVPTMPDAVTVTDTPTVSVRGFSVSAIRGQIPYDEDPATGSTGFSMVTMPVPAGTPIAELARIGGVTIFRQSTSNRSSE